MREDSNNILVGENEDSVRLECGILNKEQGILNVEGPDSNAPRFE
jgi:hypothetical protein